MSNAGFLIDPGMRSATREALTDIGADAEMADTLLETAFENSTTMGAMAAFGNAVLDLADRLGVADDPAAAWEIIAGMADRLDALAAENKALRDVLRPVLAGDIVDIDAARQALGRHVQ